MKEDSKSNVDQPLKVEDVLPVKAVGIECLKESNPEVMSPHRYLHKWFARRPTAATRLAVLSSILPNDVSNDQLLRLMQIGPRNPEHLNKSISHYVQEKYATKDNRSGSIDEHFGYPIPHSQSPTDDQLKELHSILRNIWDGELPMVLDPTAGGGTIPMEAARYGLPTFANDLNPVAWLLNKTTLEYTTQVGSIESAVRNWADKIDTHVEQELKEYYPTAGEHQSPTYYLCTYSVECPSCGMRMPLSNRWWFNKKKGDAIRPRVTGDSIIYEYVNMNNVSEDEFDPSQGVVDGGDAECLNCGVVTESEKIKEHLRSGEYEFEVCGVKYEGKLDRIDDGYRGATQEDREAMEKASEAIESDIELATLLTNPIEEGKKTNELLHYGMTEWRDIFNPRQFLAHAKYLETLEDYKADIKEEHPPEVAEAIIVILSLTSSKLIERNSRLQPIDIRRGSPANMLGSNNFAFQWHFGETNMSVGSYSYQSTLDVVLDNYEQLVAYFDSLEEKGEVTARRGDASDLPLDDDSVEAVVIDPPYGDNVMYAELSDAFYVWLREYLQSEFPDEFSSPTTNKQDEAVENTSLFEQNDDISKSDRARRSYENKMEGIFREIYRVLELGGVLTVYFTEKEIDAWDSLTMSLINSGFVLTATHPITSEMPQRVGMQGSASADTTLLLSCRKPTDDTPLDERSKTLWDDVREETRLVAKRKAVELLDSDLNLTKTDTIISSFGPTLRVFTENYPVVDKHGNEIRPKEALQEARTAVIDVLVDRELENTLDGVDDLTTWYILCWLVYERQKIPHDEARQLGIGVGVYIDEIKRDTKIWSKSGEDLILKGQSDRVQDFDKLKAGAKRRKRKFPVNPQDVNFEHSIDAVHAALNVLDTEGGNTTWNWLKDRNFANDPVFKRTIKSLIDVLPEEHEDRELLNDLIVGKTGGLLDIDIDIIESNQDTEGSTLSDYDT